MFLKTKLGVLRKPPWGKLSFTNPAQNWQWRRMVLRVTGAHVGKCSQMVGKHFGSNPE